MSDPKDGPALAELNQAILDPGVLSALFDDLEAHTQVLDVLVKGAATVRADSKPVGLREAESLLVARSVRGVQVRYRYEEAEWRDTLLARPDGVQLVRMRMDFA